MRRLGHFEEMEGFVQFLKNVAEGSPDRLQPVYAISGEAHLEEKTLDHLSGYMNNRPVRAGNAAHFQEQHDVYGEMIAAIAPLFVDVRFGEFGGGHAGLLRRLLDRIDATLESPDAGIWEYRGAARIHTFSLLMHWVGARITRRVAERLGDPDLEGRAAAIAARARDLIEHECYRETLGYYGDSTTTDHPDASLLMMVNLGYLVDKSRADRHVRCLSQLLRSRGHLMHRYLHSDDFGQSTSTFTLCGFWYAEALARLGHPVEAEEVFREIVKHANHVGLLSEDLDPATGEQLGNFPQAYSHVGLINAAFAISPLPYDVGD
jgi:GH15 family glucan-1,4-alpha-glucosidase